MAGSLHLGPIAYGRVPEGKLPEGWEEVVGDDAYRHGSGARVLYRPSAAVRAWIAKGPDGTTIKRTRQRFERSQKYLTALHAIKAIEKQWPEPKR